MEQRSPAGIDRLWSLQVRDGESSGAWEWFSLELDPWEMPESRFYGAALAALAAGYAPSEYRKLPEVREHIAALAGYLHRELPLQPLHNRLILLWAASRWKEALPDSERKPLIDEIKQKQEADGGWSLNSLGPWKHREGAPLPAGSNSYATGLTAFVLQRAGVAPSDSRLKRALEWLEAHQDRESGSWPAESMNKRYKAGSMQAGFMSAAATAFASLALLGK
jgi:squalene-hopene/tetraprenyl-beta-curcumene cyclase